MEYTVKEVAQMTGVWSKRCIIITKSICFFHAEWRKPAIACMERASLSGCSKFFFTVSLIFPSPTLNRPWRVNPTASNAWTGNRNCFAREGRDLVACSAQFLRDRFTPRWKEKVWAYRSYLKALISKDGKRLWHRFRPVSGTGWFPSKHAGGSADWAELLSARCRRSLCFVQCIIKCAHKTVISGHGVRPLYWQKCILRVIW